MEVGDIIYNRRGLEAAIALLRSTSASNPFSCIPSSPAWSRKSDVGRGLIICQPLQDMDSPRTSCSVEQGSWKDGKRGIKSALYKTEMCRNWRESQTCPYGRKCQYAHGDEELHQVARPARYKTKPCREYYNKGFCNYGQRCHFLHKSPNEQDVVLLSGDGNGVGASCLESSSDFPSQLGILGKHNPFSRASTGGYPAGDASLHELDAPSRSVDQWCSALDIEGTWENECSMVKPQFALPQSSLVAPPRACPVQSGHLLNPKLLDWTQFKGRRVSMAILWVQPLCVTWYLRTRPLRSSDQAFQSIMNYIET